MQNLASISQMIFPHQTSPKANQTSTEAPDFQKDIQNLLFGQNQMDSAIINQLNGVKTQSDGSSTFGTNMPDLTSLLAAFGQPTQNMPDNSSTAPSTSDADVASLLAMLSGQQSSSSPTANNANFLEQLQFLNAAQSLSAFGQNQMPGTPGFSPYGFGSPSKDTYCELCEKNFCNRYFLKTHKQKKHGLMIDAGDTAGKQNGTENSPVINGANDLDEPKSASEAENRLPASFETMLANAVQESVSTQNGNNPDFLSLIKQIAAGNGTPVKSESTSPDRFSCEQCDKDFSSQTQLLQHQLSHLVPSSTASNVPVSSASNLQANLLNMLPGNFGMPFMLPSTPFVKMDMEAPNFNTLSPITSLQNSMAKPVQKRQYSSTSKNFCDLCKKEVCNKYFLRTHMLKMHNIVIDENKTVIANIDTQEKEKEGSVTFRCDVCLLDMKSRNELREHKKEVHGIQPLITPTSASAQFSRASSTASKPSSAANSAIGSGSTQGSLTAFEFPSMSSADSPPSTATGNDLKCSKCDAEYANVETLVEHFRDEHPDMSPDEMIKYFAKASTSTPPLIKCPFCPEHFESEIANQLHQLKDHADVKMEDETDEAMQITKAVAYKMAVENELLMLKEETRGFEQKLSKKFACKKCSRIYHSKDKLEEHYATAHQYYLKLSPRKNRIVLSPTKVNKMIKSFSCLKCNSRFSSSELCKFHIIQHLKSERREQEDAGETSTNLVDKENNEEFGEAIVSSYMVECNEKSDLNDELERRGSHSGHAKLSEEKHSHTSGSASPMSVTVPEAYVIPLNPNNQKPYTVQTFIMREVSEDGITPRFLNDLQAFLPVFSPIDGPIRVTFELCPTPSQLDSQIKGE